jgi:hypothetical protein
VTFDLGLANELYAALLGPVEEVTKKAAKGAWTNLRSSFVVIALANECTMVSRVAS